MPAKSVAQFKAMQAAAHGKSTLGIPAKVGKEYTAGQSPKGLPKKAGKKKKVSGAAHTSVVHKKVKDGLKAAFPNY